MTPPKSGALLRAATLMVLFLGTIPLSMALAAGEYPAVGRMVLILDASGSMWGQSDGRAKIDIAKEVLANLIRDLPEDLQVGLTAYGHRRKGDCEDVEELVPVQKLDKQALVRTIQAISPKGKTPLSLSVQKTAEKLKAMEDETAIILVSDGKETCAPDPCALVKSLKQAGIRFTLYVIGFDVTEEEKLQLDCMAQAGGGRYFSAKNAQELTVATQQAIQESRNFGILEVAATKNGRIFRALVEVYTAGERRRVLSGYGTDEKSFLEKVPPGNYEVVVQDLSVPEKPSIELKGIEILVGQTSRRAAEFAREGVLSVTATKAGKPFRVFFKLHKAGESRSFLSGYAEADRPFTQKVLPGRYDVYFQDFSVLNKPEQWARGVAVEAGETGEARVDFPQHGTIELAAAQGGKPISALYTLIQIEGQRPLLKGFTETHKTISYNLLPGSYRVIFDYSKPAKVRKEVSVEIQAGQATRAAVDF